MTLRELKEWIEQQPNGNLDLPIVVHTGNACFHELIDIKRTVVRRGVFRNNNFVPRLHPRAITALLLLRKAISD